MSGAGSPGIIDITSIDDNNFIQQRRLTMATFISLTNFTDQGIKTIKESPDRFAAVKAMAEKLGLTVKSFYYTVGQYDMVLVIEGNEEAATTLMVKVASLGNVRTQTMRAHSVDEMRKILDKMP
jgi:uncharacterized protein with GYD domain